MMDNRSRTFEVFHLNTYSPENFSNCYCPGIIIYCLINFRYNLRYEKYNVVDVSIPNESIQVSNLKKPRCEWRYQLAFQFYSLSKFQRFVLCITQLMVDSRCPTRDIIVGIVKQITKQIVERVTKVQTKDNLLIFMLHSTKHLDWLQYYRK